MYDLSRLGFKPCLSKTKTETQDLQDQYWEVNDLDGLRQTKIIASRKSVYVFTIRQHSTANIPTQ